MSDWAKAASAAAPVIISLIGDAAASGDDEKAEQLRQQAMDEFNIQLPPVRTIHAEYIQSQAAKAGDPTATATRLELLKSLRQIGNEGYDAQDRAAISDMLSDVSQRERGQRMAIEQNLDPNSGAMIAAKLANQQASAQRANQQGLELAAQSRARRLQAMREQMGLANQMQDEAFQRAQAGDAMAQFNERNRIGASQWNAGQEADRFGHQMSLAAGKTGQFRGMSDYLTGKAAATRNRAAGIGQAAGKGIYAAFGDDEDEKEK